MDTQRLVRRVVTVVTALLATTALAACTAASAPASTTPTTSPDAGEQYTPVVMEVMSTPRWFTGSDDLVHVVYELQVTNAFPVDATLEQLDVRDAGDASVVRTLAGEELAAAVSLQPQGLPPVAALAPSTVGVVWLDVTFDDASQVPDAIDHSLTVRVEPGLPVPEQITSVGGGSAVDTQPPTVIGPPLAGAGWVAMGSCCDGPHRRALQPVNNELWLAQRFAIDFNRVTDENFFATGDPGLNESWPTYDQPVLAVADATVVATANDFPDQVAMAPEPVTLEQADGNYVILEIDDGVYAFYAHLKPGTVAVQPGDTVTKGQVIAQTGNSGSSSGPHLHFQLMDRPSALLADGLPYVFDSFVLQGQAPPTEEIMANDPQTVPVAIDTATSGPRTDALPLGRDVVEFPELQE